MLVSLPIAQATTGAEVFFVPVPFATRLKSIKLVAGQALTADGTNHLTVSILAADGATSLASRTTDSGSSGTSLAAGTVEDLSISNFDDSGLAANEAYKVSTAVGGTLANAVDLMLVFELESDRSY